MEKKERNISIDILRILSMLAIVIFHAQSKTEILSSYGAGKSGWLSHWGLQSLCYVAVNCYVLISGYFLSNENTKFNIKKILNIWFAVEFWSIVLFVMSSIYIGEFSFHSFLIALFPVTFREYWFVTVYIALYILAPYINKLINNLDKKQYKKLLLTVLILFSIWPTLTPYSGEDGVIGINGIGGTNLIWFMTVYIIAGYIRKFYDPEINKPIKYLIGYIVSIVIMLIFQAAMSVVDIMFGSGGNYGTWMMNYASIVNIFASVMIFTFFVCCKLKVSNNVKKIILFLSKGTFGVYLIHEHPLVRPILWNPVKNSNVSSFVGLKYLVCILTIAISVFIVCCILENIRLWIFNNVKNVCTRSRKYSMR